MLIPANGRVLIMSAITIRSKILIFMVLLLVTRARKCAIKRNHEQFHELLKLGAVIFDMLHLLRRVAVHYLTMCEKNYAD